MDDGIRTVVGPDGMHQEQESDFVRWDLATGEASLVFGDPGDGVRTVIRPDGSSAVEQQLGNMRISTDRGMESIL